LRDDGGAKLIGYSRALSLTYGIAAMPLVRSLIDCLYNVTAILQNPAEQGAAYRKSGIKRTLIDLRFSLY
jgi:hypothetical protein